MPPSGEASLATDRTHGLSCNPGSPHSRPPPSRCASPSTSHHQLRTHLPSHCRFLICSACAPGESLSSNASGPAPGLPAHYSTAFSSCSHLLATLTNIPSTDDTRDAINPCRSVNQADFFANPAAAMALGAYFLYQFDTGLGGSLLYVLALPFFQHQCCGTCFHTRHGLRGSPRLRS